MVLHFTFRSMIHFASTIVKGVRFVFFVVFLHVDVWLFQHHLLQNLFLLHCFAFVPLPKISGVFLCVSVSGFQSFPLIYFSILLLIPHCLDYCSFMVSLEVE